MARSNSADCIKPIFDFDYGNWLCPCCGRAINPDNNECSYCCMELEWNTVPWWDITNWICPMCGVGMLEEDYGKLKCWYCNCNLDWGEAEKW